MSNSDDDERDPLLPGGGLKRARSNSSYFKDYLMDFSRSRWISIGIAYFVAFTVSMQTAVDTTSLFQFMIEIDESTTTEFYGMVTVAFYLVAAVASFFYGFLANVVRQTKCFVITALVFQFAGSLLLFSTPAFATKQKYVVLVSKMLTGCGFAILGILAAFVVMESTHTERCFAVSMKCAVTSLANVFGAVLQLVFVPLKGSFKSTDFLVNMFTAPPLAFACLAFIQIFIVWRFYSEHWIAVKRCENRQHDMVRKDSVFDTALPNFDKVAAGALIFIRASFEFTRYYIRSVQAPLTIAMFDWDPNDAVVYNGILTLVSGIIALVANILDGNLIMKYIQERVLLAVSVCSVVLFYAISFPSTHFLPSMDYETCDYAWCRTGAKVTLEAFLGGYGFLVLGYGFSVVPNCILFTKVIGPRKQGTMQGLFNSVSEMILVVAPVGNIFLVTYGAQLVWFFGLVVTFVTVFVLVVTFDRLKPLSF